MKYVAKFKIYSGEATYEMIVKTEADTKLKAEEYFRAYECDTNLEIWKLQTIQQINNFEELWEFI